MDNIRKANLQNPEAQNSLIYNDGELAFERDVRGIAALLPARLEIHVIMLILKGRATVQIDGVHYELKKDDLFVGSPNQILENGLVSVDFEGCLIFVSAAYVQRILPMAGHAWDYKLLFKKHPVCTLLPDEVTVFCQYYDLLCSKVQQTTHASKRVIDTLMLAFFYDMENCLNRVAQPQTHPFTSGESLFQRFITLLSSSYPKPRSVTWYADQLNITPKYLSTLCKQAGGKRPTELIEMYVNKDIDFLMRHSQKTVKEIAYELDFPNLSFFGKYMRRNFGLSPKAYREQALKETVK